MSNEADRIYFIGQNGKILKQCDCSSCGFYTLTPSDHYVRIVVEYPSGAKIYLNPVFRYGPGTRNRLSFHINYVLTDMRRALAAIVAAFWLIFGFSFTFARSSSKTFLTQPFNVL
jgi:hypothetical protein